MGLLLFTLVLLSIIFFNVGKFEIRTNIILSIILVSGYLFYNMLSTVKSIGSESKRTIKNLEKRIYLSEKKSPSFKIETIVEPNWNKILLKALNDNSKDKIIDRIISQYEPLLYGKSFRWVEYNNGYSGMDMIYSDHHKTFVGGKGVVGELFKNIIFENLNNPELNNTKLLDEFKATPKYMGFISDLDFNDVMGKDRLSVFPYDQIIDFLHDINKHLGDIMDAMTPIKAFPKDIHKELKKGRVQYLADNGHNEVYYNNESETIDISEYEWAMKNGIEFYADFIFYHIFKTEYSTLKIRINHYNHL